MASLRELGQTGLHISSVGLGAWQFSEGAWGVGSVWNALSAEETKAIVKTSLEGGINWIDTAEAYGFGRSERGVSQALQAMNKADGDVLIATKWFPLLRFARNIKRNIRPRRAYLYPYSVDLYQIHFAGSLSSLAAQINAMADLVSEGLIKAVGISNFTADDMRQAHDILSSRGLTLASNQVEYHLLKRSIERNGILDAAKELGITIIAYSPVAKGLLTGKFHRDPALLEKVPAARRRVLKSQIEASQPVIDVLEKIAIRLNVTPAQVALNWVINAHGETVVAIPGASKVHHAEENAACMDFILHDEDIALLNEVSRGI